MKTKLFLFSLLLFLFGNFTFAQNFLNPTQYKSDGQTEIAEGITTTEDAVIFKATVSDPQNDQVKLEVELRRMDEFGGNFLNAPTASSTFVSSGSILTITASDLIDGQYHWQTRVKDINGNTSDWVEFGIPGNVDFIVKLMPLYTQVRSPYPSDDETKIWAARVYAEGRGNIDPPGPEEPCGLTIEDCGCAITSSVMLLRYYDIDTAFDNKSVDPLNFNDWLNLNKGYDKYGNLKWPKVSEYSKDPQSNLAKLLYSGRFDIGDVFETTFNNLRSTTDVYLNSHEPVIIRNQTFGHFLVANEKLATTYAIRDPFWYNTKNLDSDITNGLLRIRDYDNQFSGIRLYNKISHLPDGISFSLASPAELLITDPQGRRLGKDPISNISYHEIPNAFYGPDGISGADTEVPLPPYEVKNIWISHSEEGQYNVQVIGTATGTYSFDSLIYDAEGNSHEQTFEGKTQINQITPFIADVTLEQPENIYVQSADRIPPEAKIFFDLQALTFRVEGEDNITSSGPTVTQNGNVFFVTDVASNTTTLIFDKLKQKGKELKSELYSLQYNSQPIIELPKATLNVEWSIDKKTQKINQLTQKLNVDNQFTVEAKYNGNKNETEIKIDDGKKERSTTPGLVVIKLVTEFGKLSFELQMVQQDLSMENELQANNYAAGLYDTFFKRWFSVITNTIKSAIIKTLQFLKLSSKPTDNWESPEGYSANDVLKTFTHGVCLEDNEKVEYAGNSRENVGPVDIIIKDKNSGEEIYKFTIDSVLLVAYPVQSRQCGVYALRIFNYNSMDIMKSVKDHKYEIWRYSYNGEGRLLFSLGKDFSLEFNVDFLESYFALLKGYLGRMDFAIIIKDIKTLEDAFSLYMIEIEKQNPDLVGTFGFEGWTKDSRYFWGHLSAAANVFGFFRIDMETKTYELFKAPSNTLGGDALNIEKGLITVTPRNEWFGIAEAYEAEKELRRKQDIRTELYIHNLFTGEQWLVDKTDEPLHYFRSWWVSDTELQYELPNGEKKIFKINE